MKNNSFCSITKLRRQITIRHTWLRHTPSRGIWWTRAVLHFQVSLTFTVRHKVSLICMVTHTQVRCTPFVRGIWWPRAVLCQVSLTFTVRHEVSLTYGRMQLSRQLTVRCTPSRGIWWPRAILHKVIMTLGYSLVQADLQSDVPPVEASGGQE